MADPRDDTAASTGLVYGLAAYTMWGLAPLFWRLLAGVGALELLAHRLVWAWVFFFGWCAVRGLLPQLRAAARDPSSRRRLGLSSLLLASNWFVFVYAVLTERVLDASLGYFINPLVSVALGWLVLGERLRSAQVLALGTAGVGIGLATWHAGGLPWISAVLALSFGLYGLLRKTTQIQPIVGSTFETTLLLPFGLATLAWLAADGGGELGRGSAGVHALLVATGLVTALPLLAFVNAAVRVRLTTLGFLQYVAPSLQFVLASLAFGEPLATGRLLGYAFVWLALVVFAVDAWRHAQRPA